jgi:hypothetical protein
MFHSVVGKHKAVFTNPPTGVPAGMCADQFENCPVGTGTSIDAPLLGNGDLLAAFSGEPRYPQFWLTTNDFWEMKSDGWIPRTQSFGAVGPRPVGRIVFDIPSMQDAGYHVEQDFSKAVTTAVFTAKEGTALKLRCWIAAVENLLVVEFTAEGSPVEIGVSFKFPDELGCGVDRAASPPKTAPVQEKGWSSGAFWATRAYLQDVDQPVKVAVSGRFAEQEGETASLVPGKPVVFTAAVKSWFKNIRPLEMVRSRVEWLRKPELEDLWLRHKGWWENYWSVSEVEINDPVIEQRYYLSLYVLGSLSRDPDFPPCIFGIETWDNPVWAGDYKINYNHQAPYLALYASGHFEQADPHDAPYLALMEQGKEMALRLLNHRGVYFPLGLGPKGLICENCLYGMKSQNAFALINVAMRWYMTYDPEYARKLYPLVREVADFWEDDLIFENGRYVATGDSAHESLGDPAVNTISVLGYLRALYRLALSMSSELQLDEHLHGKWWHILEHMSDFPAQPAAQVGNIFFDIVQTEALKNVKLADLYPAGALEGKTVFVHEEVGSQWSFMCAVNLLHAYPAGEIGLDSDASLLRTARNTIELKALFEKESIGWQKNWGGLPIGSDALGRGGWTDFNHSCLFFPAAVRVGYDPAIIWKELRQLIESKAAENGFIRNNPHGIENCGTVPNTIQEMMLQSHENVIRLFPVWPRADHPDAGFTNLWAYGAFKVSATLRSGVVGNVSITSMKGRRCTVENPWEDCRILLQRNGCAGETVHGRRFSFQTQAGETIRLVPSDPPPSAAAV